MMSSLHPWLSVVIPIKDERDNLVLLVDRLVALLESREETRTAPFEIFFIDDGSTDGSSLLLDRLAGQHQAVRIISFDRNYGKTAALDAGFKQARGERIVIMDGDLQNDVGDIATLLLYASQHDLVCGRRATRKDNLIRKISSRLANFIRNAVIHDGMHDTGCGFMLFRRHVIERLPLFEGMHRFFPALAMMYGFTVTEVPVCHHPRLHGRSKYGIRNRLMKGLLDMMAVRWMQRRRLRYRIRESAAGPAVPRAVAHPGSPT